MVEVSSRPHTQGFNAYFESAPKDPNVKLEAGQEESYYCPQPVQQEINCDSAASVFDTGHAKSSPVRKYVRKDDAETMKFDINSVSRNWVVAGGADQIHGYVAAVGDQAPADAVYSPAVVAGWLTEGEGAEFIAASAPYQRNDLANQFVQPDRDIRSFYYKTEFELTDEQAAKNLKLIPTFEADDYIAAVWVNGVRVFYNTELQKYMASDTYVKRNDEPRIAKPFDVEFTAEARKMPQMELSDFVKGKNTIEVQVASHSNAEKVKMTFAYAPSVAAQGGLCPQSPTQPRKDKADRPTLLPKTGTDSTQAAVLAALTLSAAGAIALRGRKQR